MRLIPIKLLEDHGVRDHLLSIKGDVHMIDETDRVERVMETNRDARHLMAIEDASEMAKYFLHQPGIFETIGIRIRKESGRDFSFSCGLKPWRTDYIHLEKHFPDTGEGHYGMAELNRTTNHIRLFDSMGKQSTTFRQDVRTAYPECTISYEGSAYQPSGGFVQRTAHDFKMKANVRFKDDRILDTSFEISLYDELSQHHFCYIEAFVAMMHLTMGTPLGPTDPRDRLVFIKKVIWGLVHMVTRERDTPEWLYFTTNFRYYMTVRDERGDRFRLQHIAQIPTGGCIRRTVLPIDIEVGGTLKEIIQLAI